jgi:uncharacterized protein (TIGR00375 family)
MVAASSYIADLHIHSRYSRATSKASTLHGLACWAVIKGIDVVGTGDFTHPGWFAHLCEHLEPAEPGFFKLRHPPFYEELAPVLPPGVQPDTSGIRFVLSSEISSIYKRGGKVRKVHNILFAPDLDAVRRINTTLAGIGNLEADGRPILGLDSQILLEILLEHAPDGFFVPAHVWTPWFSLFGSKSGFDAVEECFGDLADEIFALETGLSSDPAMNRCISALDRFTLISNSDCHSPSKLGREANIFACDFDFFSMQEAIRHPVAREGTQQFAATIEFYPEEGKYHCDGHRKCAVCLEPAQTIKKKGICPQCGRPLTIGVLYRVMELADRQNPVYPKGSPAVHSLVPLPEVLGELFNVGPATKKVAHVYGKLINTFGSEFSLLLDTPIADLAAISPMLGEAIKRVREDQVIRRPGFDGEFGVIRVFTDEERATAGGQLSLFGTTPARPRKKKSKIKAVFSPDKITAKTAQPARLNAEQQAAVDSTAQCILVKAGPGTGKTHTLVQRVKRLLAGKQGPVTVITFTNKAADEIRARLEDAGNNKKLVRVDTFHGFCLYFLRQYAPELLPAGPEMRRTILARAYPERTAAERRILQREISLFLSEQPLLPEKFPQKLNLYFQELRRANLLDLDEVVPACTALMASDDSFTSSVSGPATQLLVDEFQDLNAGQYELVRRLSLSCSIFAIGDPDQAIYGFRGSRPAWFQLFIDRQQPEQHVLVRNYRSGTAILQAAARIIAENHRGGIPGGVVAAGEGCGTIHRYTAADPQAEARCIADQIQRLVGGTSHREIERISGDKGEGLALSDIAVLYRTGKQGKAIAEALADRSLPCQVVDIKPFYTTGDARLIYYTLLLAADMADRAELCFLLGREKGVGSCALAVVDKVLDDNTTKDSLFADLRRQAHLLPAVVRKKVVLLVRRVERCSTVADTQSVAAAVRMLLDEQGMDVDEPGFLHLQQMALSADSLKSFANHLRSYQETLVYDPRAESVLLTTLHASKGLEFKAVFLAGCEEGLLPVAKREDESSAAREEQVQEERRLFYVGMTRAAQFVFISDCRLRHGFAGVEQPIPSRFLADIPEELISPIPVLEKRAKKTSMRQLRLF